MTDHLFEQIFENSPVAMLLVDVESQIHLVNKKAEKLFGYSRDEILGRSVDILVPESTRAKHPALVRGFFEAPLPRQMGRGRNLFGIKKDGTEFPVEVGLNPLEKDGKILVMSSVIDTTYRVKAEERVRAVVESAPSGMVMIDAIGTIQMVNKKTEEIFDYKREDLLGKPIEILIPDEFKEPHPRFVANYMKQPVPRAVGIGRELFGRRSDGSLFPVEVGLQPVQSQEGVFVISSIADITLRREAESKVKEKTEELEEFAYRTSHDLKTPLLSISGLADCIKEDLAEQEYDEASINAEKISLLAMKLQSLVASMLSLTKMDLKSEKKERFDFPEYFETVKTKYISLLEETGVSVTASLMHKVEFNIPTARLTQILDNLIGNGIKYADPDKEHRFVNLHTFNDLKNFFIQVEDNGFGIPQGRQREVFGMFKRFHESSGEGNGLGLYMVRKHVEKLGAEITFDSGPKGTVFYLKFPLQR